jgi:hypothetical protein
VALLTGCLVTFNDYPEGDLGAGNLTAGAGNRAGADGGSMSAAGSATAGVSGSGVGAIGGTDLGGSDSVGGSTPVDVGGTTSEAGAGDDTPSAGAAPIDDDPNLIDDFEDGDELIFERQGRKGAWFVTNDGRGIQTPEAGAAALPSAFVLTRDGSARGMHTTGGPFQTWGAMIGTTLAADGDTASGYDLSGYQGLELWVRSNSMLPGAAKQVRLNLVTPATSSNMSSCTPCGDHWGADIPLTSKWVLIDVPFADLDQSGGFGGPRPPVTTMPDLTSVTSLQFQFPQGVSFDLWLDDILLY